MEQILLDLLEQLEALLEDNKELRDTEVREIIGGYVLERFARQKTEFAIPEHLGLYSEEEDVKLRHLLTEYVNQMIEYADTHGLNTFHERLAAFQNDSVITPKWKNSYDSFFGYCPPEWYDEDGNVILGH